MKKKKSYSSIYSFKYKKKNKTQGFLAQKKLISNAHTQKKKKRKIKIRFDKAEVR